MNWFVVYTAAAIALTTVNIYFAYRILRIARKSLLSKILYDLLVVVLFLWLHSFSIVFLLVSMPGWQFFYSMVYFVMPVSALYLLWDVLRYVREKSAMR